MMLFKLNKNPEILHVLPELNYTEETAQLFGQAASGHLDVFGFRYWTEEQDKFAPVFTKSQRQSERSFAWLGTLVSSAFIEDAATMVRAAREQEDLDHQGVIRFTEKLSREQAASYAREVGLEMEQRAPAPSASQETVG